MIIFAKSHISGYTKKDGTIVAPHEDKRIKSNQQKSELIPYDSDSEEVEQYFDKIEKYDIKNGLKTFYHASPDKNLTKILDSHASGRHDFAGIFGADGPRQAYSKWYGDYVYEVTCPANKVASDSDIRNIIENDDGIDELIEDAVLFQMEEGDIDIVKNMLLSSDDNLENMSDDDLSQLGWGDAETVSYETQRIRGVIASANGYLAVEEGDGYLILPGADVKLSRVQHQSVLDKRLHNSPLAKAVLFIKSRPTEAQIAAGNYKKPRIAWHGLEIAIENPVGTVRSGPGWRTVMKNAYGYVCRSEAVDGDECDVYIGPDMDTAPMVYVVHQRKAGDWKAYDEDKSMLGFSSEVEARAAYLKHYDDKRFLGPITAMPVDEFVAKVRATYDKPAMIKAIGGALVLFMPPS